MNFFLFDPPGSIALRLGIPLSGGIFPWRLGKRSCKRATPQGFWQTDSSISLDAICQDLFISPSISRCYAVAVTPALRYPVTPLPLPRHSDTPLRRCRYPDTPVPRYAVAVTPALRYPVTLLPLPRYPVTPILPPRGPRFPWDFWSGKKGLWIDSMCARRAVSLWCGKKGSWEGIF